jgi:very-short-patch-repair endonuclease
VTKPKPAQLSPLERHLLTHIRMCGLPEPETQYRLLENRRFKWDFAWPGHRLLVEVQGGTWCGGAHARPKGISRDCEKLNIAQIHGWQQLSFTSDQIRGGQAIQTLRDFFRQRDLTADWT